jgi:hypothetical protein
VTAANRLFLGLVIPGLVIAAAIYRLVTADPQRVEAEGAWVTGSLVAIVLGVAFGWLAVREWQSRIRVVGPVDYELRRVEPAFGVFARYELRVLGPDGRPVWVSARPISGDAARARLQDIGLGMVETGAALVKADGEWHRRHLGKPEG